MREIKPRELKEILENHKKWINGEDGGEMANLYGADLYMANLYESNLRGANLYGANLREAKTDKRYVIVSCVGSRKDSTTYCFDDDIVWCGCWKGNLDDFEKIVLEKYPDKDNKHHKEYIGFINYLRSLK